MNTLRTLTIIFNLLIIIGAGHGGAPLGFFEIITLRDIFLGDFQFKISGSYDDRLLTVGLFSFFGQCVLICSYFFDKDIKSRLTLIGCLILLAATFLLTNGALTIFSLELFSLFTALPFIGTSLVLLTREIKGLRSIEGK